MNNGVHRQVHPKLHKTLIINYKVDMRSRQSSTRERIAGL